jgi:hypothetical protein
VGFSCEGTPEEKRWGRDYTERAWEDASSHCDGNGPTRATGTFRYRQSGDVAEKIGLWETEPYDFLIFLRRHLMNSVDSVRVNGVQTYDCHMNIS